ncbi:putative sulfoacetate transporter SauU [Castellaniella defragrans]
MLVAVTCAFFDRINVAVLFTDQEFLKFFGLVGQPARAGLLMSAFLLAYGISSTLISFIGDTSFGARKTFIVITLAWTIFMPVMGITTSFALLILFRVLLGVSEGPQFSVSAKIVSSWFPRHEHARANALWAVGSPIGAALGFPLVVFLDVNYGWESTFFVLGAITLVIVLPLLLLYVHNEPSVARGVSRKELDYIRAVDKTAAESAPEDATAKANFMADVSFWMVTLCFVCYLGLIWGFNSWLPSYFKVARHLDVRAMGAFSSASFAMMFLGEILGSAFSDRLGRRAIVCFVAQIALAVLLGIALMVSNDLVSAYTIVVSLFFLGATVPVSFALLLKIVAKSRSSAGFGVCNGVGNIVSSVVPFLVGLAVKESGSYNVGFSLLVVLAAVGALSMVPILVQRRGL